MSLDEQLLKDFRAGKDINIERALLIASDAQTEEEVAAYTEKIDQIHEQFKAYRGAHPSEASPFETGEEIFDFLLSTNNGRYNGRKDELKTEIDAHLGEEDTSNEGLFAAIGRFLSRKKDTSTENTIGLKLFVMLGLRENLSLTALHGRDPSDNPEYHNDPKIEIRIRDGEEHVDVDTPENGYGVPRLDYRESPLITFVASAFMNHTVHTRNELSNEEEVERYKMALKLDPKNSLAHSNIGMIYLEAGFPKAARKELNIAIDLDERNHGAYAVRSQLHNQLGDHDAAIEDAKMAVYLRPHDLRYHNTLGMTYLGKGDLEMALECFNSGLSFNHTDPVLYMNKIHTEKQLANR